MSLADKTVVVIGGSSGMGLATAGGAVLRLFPLGFVIGVGLPAAGSLFLRHSARAVCPC